MSSSTKASTSGLQDANHESQKETPERPIRDDEEYWEQREYGDLEEFEYNPEYEKWVYKWDDPTPEEWLQWDKWASGAEVETEDGFMDMIRSCRILEIGRTFQETQQCPLCPAAKRAAEEPVWSLREFWEKLEREARAA
ncbi:MAG: hypothetical protein M1816_007491 [Peltula sp. TS41687]|nr:MAG: hypothetical protein M1816_007491 [Peltula sp. TS41687]